MPRTTRLCGMKGLTGSVIISVFLLGCSQEGTAPSYETGSTRSSGSSTSSRSSDPAMRESPAPRVATQAHSRTSQMDFLNSIRQADPRHQTIERALMNEQNELGIVLSRQVNMDDIPALMRSLLKQMAAQFPGEDLTVIAYAPADPPLKVGTARLDAQTREMTYTPAQRGRL